MWIDGKNQQFQKSEYGPEIATDYITKFMTQHRDERFFVYYPMILVHSPFVPTPDSESHRSKDKQRNFEDMVEFMDKLVSEIYTGEWEFHVTAAIILENKGTEVISVGPDMTVYDGNKLLAEQRIGSAVVLDSNGDLIGVFSERDVVTGLAEFGAEVLKEPLTKVMTHDVIVGYPNDTLQELMSCMTDRRIRHIPIVDGGKLKGIVSIGDVVKARMDELETEGAAMQDYIDNRRWREVAFQVGRAAATEQVG